MQSRRDRGGRQTERTPKVCQKPGEMKEGILSLLSRGLGRASLSTNNVIIVYKFLHSANVA
jgi:hypothetical protein